VPVLVGDLVVTPFRKCHDACDPYSFIIGYDEIRVGVFTDIGTPCQNLVNYFRQCHAAFLEANFDETMLKEGDYPYFLKKRISGGNGHLSNRLALELFKTHKPAFMSHLLLAHLSKNNNCPILVQKLFEDYADGVTITVASRYAETAVYHIDNRAKDMIRRSSVAAAQLAFSFA
jgi:phosphoribosyl 1,2-cyclic phosphodiesterase